jgi:hypothetical protein
VTPGSYTHASITVDQQGRLTAASSGANPLPLAGGTMTGLITSPWALATTMPVTWTQVSGGIGFQNSWVDFGGSYTNAAYAKDALGIVHLRGMIKSGTSATTAFTLPAGFRPVGQLGFPVDGGGAMALVNITSAGLVQPNGASTGSFTTLDGITFFAEN